MQLDILYDIALGALVNLFWRYQAKIKTCRSQILSSKLHAARPVDTKHLGFNKAQVFLITYVHNVPNYHILHYLLCVLCSDARCAFHYCNGC